ncbi:MAG: hypothetical protein V2I33_23655 [Kangiellaceae bacterium]|jgi:hypothetical protein|nr:hypothetical protein [Kangiellaceae bacterium]
MNTTPQNTTPTATAPAAIAAETASVNAAASGTTTPEVTVVQLDRAKSVFAAVVLAFLFGPLGLLYASIPGGIIMTILALITLPLTAFFAALVIWPICMIWAVVAALRSKSKLRKAKVEIGAGGPG